MSSASRDLVIRIRGDSAEFVAAVEGAGRHLDDFNTRVESIDRSASATTASLARMGHGLTAFLGVREVVSMADAYGQYASRMHMAVDSSLEYEQAQRRMVSSANETFRSINETRESFILMNPVLREMGLSLDQSINAIDTFSGLLVVNAASAERGAQAQAALAKSLQSGRIEADSWQSMLTAMPSLVKVLADSSGKSEAEIRKLGINGKLSVEMLTQALVSGNVAVMEQVAAMPTAVADALTKLSNGFGEWIGRGNEALGATAAVASAIGALGDNFDTFGNGVLVVAGALTGRYVVALGFATAAKMTLINQTRAASIAEAKYRVDLARTAVLQAQGTMSSTALAAARQREAVATQALAAAESRLAAAAGLARGAVGALGGPIGIATMVLTAGATAWMVWGNRADEAAKKAAAAADDHIQSVIEKLFTLNADIERMSRKSVEVAIQSGMDSLTENAIQMDKAASQVKRLTAEIAVARDAGFSQRSIDNKTQELADANIRYQALLKNEAALQASVAAARDQAARAGVQAVKDFADANSVGATRVARERARLQEEFDRIMAAAGGYNADVPEHVAARRALDAKLAELVDKPRRGPKVDLNLGSDTEAASAYGRAMERLIGIQHDSAIEGQTLTQSQRVLRELMLSPEWARMPEPWQQLVQAQAESTAAAEATGAYQRTLVAIDASVLDVTKSTMELDAAQSALFDLMVSPAWLQMTETERMAAAARAESASATLQELELERALLAARAQTTSAATARHAAQVGYVEQQYQAGRFGAVGSAEAEAAKNEIIGVMADKNLTSGLSRNVASALVSGFQTGANVFDSLGSMLRNVLMQKSADGLEKGISMALDVASSWIGDLFKSTGGGGGGLFGSILGWFASANGNAFAGHGAVHAFAAGGAFGAGEVLTRPTFFQLADGGTFRRGVAGEAGPEAALPLKRMANGKLGVYADVGASMPVSAGPGAGGGAGVYVAITVNADGSGRTEQQSGGSAEQSAAGLAEFGRRIEGVVRAVIMEESRPGGLLAGA